VQSARPANLVSTTVTKIGEDNMAVEEIRVSRAYLDDLNQEIAALKLQVAQLKQELAAAKAAQAPAKIG